MFSLFIRTLLFAIVPFFFVIVNAAPLPTIPSSDTLLTRGLLSGLPLVGSNGVNNLLPVNDVLPELGSLPDLFNPNGLPTLPTVGDLSNVLPDVIDIQPIPSLSGLTKNVGLPNLLKFGQAKAQPNV